MSCDRSFVLTDQDVDEILSLEISTRLRNSLNIQKKARENQRLLDRCGIFYRDGAEWMPLELAVLFCLCSLWSRGIVPHCAGIERRIGEPTMVGLEWRL